MQKGRGGRDVFDANDSFSAGFGGGFRSVIPSLFGGRDPFDDPFFSPPFGSMFGASTTASSNAQQASTSKSLVIQELNSDDEGDENYQESGGEGKESRQKTSGSSSMEPSVEHPDDADVLERKINNVTNRSQDDKVQSHQGPNVSFQTCRVTYGGVDGVYYTSARSRRAASDGVVLEESKEADKTTGQASHRISRGINDKGHSVTRKLKSDGNVDTMQTLHNLNEDELAGFEEAWKDNHVGQFPGWEDVHDVHGNRGSSVGEQKVWESGGVWSLPSSEQRGRCSGYRHDESRAATGRAKKVVRINIE